MENAPLPPPPSSIPHTDALELRAIVDAELTRHDLSWKSERVKTWMTGVAAIAGHPVTCPADVPFEAFYALLDKLDEEGNGQA